VKLLPFVNFASVSELDNKHSQNRIFDLVDNAIVTNTNAPKAILVGEFFGFGWLWIGSEKLRRCQYPSLSLWIETAKLL